MQTIPFNNTNTIEISDRMPAVEFSRTQVFINPGVFVPWQSSNSIHEDTSFSAGLDVRLTFLLFKFYNLSSMTARLQILKAIGKRLKEVRHQKALSLNDLAAMTGIAKGDVSKIEAGKKSIELITLLRIVYALEAPPGKILDNIDLSGLE